MCNVNQSLVWWHIVASIDCKYTVLRVTRVDVVFCMVASLWIPVVGHGDRSAVWSMVWLSPFEYKDLVFLKFSWFAEIFLLPSASYCFFLLVVHCPVAGYGFNCYPLTSTVDCWLYLSSVSVLLDGWWNICPINYAWRCYWTVHFFFC